MIEAKSLPPPGQLVGPYRIVRLLGQGGMGAVFEAWDTRLQRRVALKFLLEYRDMDPKLVQRFLREASAASRVEHPGVVQVLDVGRSEGETPYIALEYVDGETLHAYDDREMRRTGRVGRAGLKWIWQLAVILSALHKKGIVHRDLKPANVMMVPDEIAPDGVRIKILDFGIAKILHQGEEEEDLALTATGAQLGTPVYMAPEQFNGTIDSKNAEQGKKLDVYALGVLTYMLLAGRYPLKGPTRIAQELLAKEVEPEPIGSLDPTLEPELCQLVTAMLAKTAEARPDVDQVREVLGALEGKKTSRQIEARIRPTVELREMRAGLSVADSGAMAPTEDAPGTPAKSPTTTDEAVAALLGMKESPGSGSVSIGARNTTPGPSDPLTTGSRSQGEKQRASVPSVAATPARRARSLGLVIAGGVALSALAIAVVIRPHQQDIERQKADSAARAATSQVAGQPVPSAPSALATALPDSKLPEAAIVPADAQKVKEPCKPMTISDSCISGSLSATQKAELVTLALQQHVGLCSGEKFIIATTPSYEIRKVSGIRKGKIETLLLALRGSRMKWTGDVTFQCKKN